MLKSHLIALCIAFALTAPASADPTTLSLLGVDSANQADAQPAMGPAIAAAPAAPGAGDACTVDPAALHKDGQRVALIVRGSNFGIHPYVQQFVGRLASALGGDAGMQAFLKDNLEKTYLSDEKETRACLERMGYAVKILSSAELGADPAGFKTTVLDELAKPETSIYVFYGHGSPSCMQLWGGREHQAPGPDEIRAMLQGDESGAEYLSPDDVKGALAKRGDAGKLDAMIMHSCRGGTYPYTHSGAGSWADCVKDGGKGFFAGWVTYAVYFTPQTATVLDAYFCHAKKVLANAAANELATTARYYTKSGPMFRQMAMIAGMDDEASIVDEHGGNYATFESDASVHEHVEPRDAAHGLEALIGLAFDLKYGPNKLGADLKKFFGAYAKYCKEAGIDMSRGGRPAPQLSDPPTRDEVNALIAYHGPETLSAGLGALLPGLLVLKYGKAWIDENDLLQIDVSADINKAKDVDALLEVISGAYVGKATAAVGGAVPGAVGTDSLTGGTHAFGLGIGAELASRVKSTIEQVKAKLPDQLLSLRVRMSLEKVPPARRREKATARITIFGYNLSVGEVPRATRDSRASPYEIHVALRSVNGVVKPLVMGMLGDEIELKYTYSPSRFLPSVSLYAYVKLHEMADITGDGQTFSGSATVQLRVNWGPFGNGYAYATFDGTCAVSTPGGLTLGLAPTGTISNVRGLPGPQWLESIFVGLAQQRVNAQIAKAIPGTLDIGALIPAQFREQIVGKVKIGKVEIKDGVVSVYMENQ